MQQFTFTSITLFSWFRYLVFAGTAYLLFYILFRGYFTKNKIQSRTISSKDILREVANSLLTGAIFAAIVFVFLATPVREYTQIYTDIEDYSLVWWFLSVPLTLVIHDTYFYWMHRLVHLPRIFKWTHLVHHKSVNPSPFASYSFQFTEAILEVLIIPILVFTLPLHSSALILFTLCTLIINVYGHLGYEIAPRWFRNSWLFEILNSSVHHNMHHSKFQGNYGLYFRFWDRIMGTENPDYVKEFDKIQKNRFGSNLEARLKKWKKV